MKLEKTILLRVEARKRATDSVMVATATDSSNSFVEFVIYLK